MHVDTSSIIFEAIRTVLDSFIFLWKRFERKKAPKRKTNDFQRFYTREKLLPLLLIVCFILFC